MTVGDSIARSMPFETEKIRGDHNCAFAAKGGMRIEDILNEALQLRTYRVGYEGLIIVGGTNDIDLLVRSRRQEEDQKIDVDNLIQEVVGFWGTHSELFTNIYMVDVLRR